MDMTRIDYSKKKDGKAGATKDEIAELKEANKVINDALKKKAQQKEC